MTADLRPVRDDIEVHRGQLRLAERLCDQERSGLRYVHGIGWHVWDGTRLAPDRDGEATRRAVAVVKAAYSDLPTMGRDDQKDLLSDIHKCESSSGLEGMLRLAGSLRPLAVAVDELDRDPFLLNTASGTLDLRTGHVRPHDPKDLLTKVTGCGYDPTASSASWDQFLADILPDPVMSAFVARVLGHALLGQVREHLLPILTGTGCNGKSTLVETVAVALGDYAIAADPELLVDKGNTHPTGQADLLGVRLAFCSETDAGRRLDAARVKRLTGGDTVRARRMRENFFEFTPSHSVVLVTNHKPLVAGDDPALWRRLRLVPFDVVVDKPDTDLKERLLLDLPAVLAWMVRGYQDWMVHGLAEPEQVTSATADYQASSDVLGRFLDECYLRVHDAATVRASTLFASWSTWCHTNGEDPGSEKNFAAGMDRKGYTKKRRSNGFLYLGLMPINTQDEQ